MRKLSKAELIEHREALAARVAVSPVAEVAPVATEEVTEVATEEVVAEEVVAVDKPKRKSKKNDTEVADEEHTHDENCEHSEEV